MKTATFFALCFMVISLQYASAQIPQTMSYQGVLTGADGIPVTDGSYSLTFILYEVPSNGDSLWSETQNVQVTGGLFNVILGSVTPLNLLFDKQYWLGISIGNEGELTPRTALTASPYSLNSHSTLLEPQPGQGLTIRNLSGEATHQFDISGNVIHSGVGKFLGGVVVGDTIKVPLDTGAYVQSTSQFQKQNLVFNINEEIPSVGISTKGLIIGIYGEGRTVGVQGESNLGAGIYGHSQTQDGVQGYGLRYGVYGNSALGEAGVFGESLLKKGVWGKSSGASVDGIGVLGESLGGVGVFGTSSTGPGVVGSSAFIAGLFKGKLQVDVVPQAPNQERFLVWDDDNVVKYRTIPTTGGFDGILQDKALVVKSGQTEIFRVDTNGNSYHKGIETFDDDVIFKGTDGKGAKLVDGNGETIAGFGRKDIQTGQIIGVIGKAQNPGDLAGFFNGDVDVTGEIVTASLHIVDGNGDTLTSFNADGTSYHTGVETYLAGIDLPDNNTGNTTGNVKAGKFNQGASQRSFSLQKSYLSSVEVPQIEGSTLSFNPTVDNEPVIWGYTERTSGPSVFGQNTNTTNTYPAIWGANFGGGAGVVGEVRNTSSNYPGMWAITYGTGTAFLIDHQGSVGNIFLGRSSGTNMVRIDKSGKGFFNGGTQTGGADVAEAFEVEGLVDEYEPGDVMVISTQRNRTVAKSIVPYSTLVLGVYATKPGVLLTKRSIDDSYEDTIPLGVIGIIPTKVCDENGSIRRGDLLVTSSLPGIAMKGTDKDKLMGAVLGKALEDFNGIGTGVIEVMVNAK